STTSATTGRASARPPSGARCSRWWTRASARRTSASGRAGSVSAPGTSRRPPASRRACRTARRSRRGAWRASSGPKRGCVPAGSTSCGRGTTATPRASRCRSPAWRAWSTRLTGAAGRAARVPYGTPVTRGRLASIARAEAGLRALGFDELRVRHYGDTARIEVPVARLADVVDARDQVVAAVRGAGYRYVTLDLE